MHSHSRLDELHPHIRKKKKSYWISGLCFKSLQLRKDSKLLLKQNVSSLSSDYQLLVVLGTPKQFSSSLFSWWHDVLVQNSDNLQTRRTWQNGLVDVRELFQVFKVERLVKHLYIFTRISPHHSFFYLKSPDLSLILSIFELIQTIIY